MTTWPEKPTAHDDDPWHERMRHESTWRPPGPQGREEDDGPYELTFRTCSYCGSIAPEDAVELLRASPNVHVADMKYGWPHKIYLDVPNPIAGEDVRVGSKSWTDDDGKRHDEEIRGAAPAHVQAKLYATHLRDTGMSAESFAAIAGVLAHRTGIRFEMNGDKLLWSRPIRADG
jgi:hypothetical protein